MINERFELITDRLGALNIAEEVQREYVPYFEEVFRFVKKVLDTYEFVRTEEIYKASKETLRQKNTELFADIFPENYEKSFFNPAYSVDVYGKELGQVLSFVAAEMRALIGFAYEQDLEPFLIRLELLMGKFSFPLTLKRAAQLSGLTKEKIIISSSAHSLMNPSFCTWQKAFLC